MTRAGTGYERNELRLRVSCPTTSETCQESLAAGSAIESGFLPAYQAEQMTQGAITRPEEGRSTVDEIQGIRTASRPGASSGPGSSRSSRLLIPVSLEIEFGVRSTR